ncbi:methyltransferase domain-containing protein [Streptomyces sp. OF3]|uniref:Methyltransferase domain-containing protein n=1 Tax=Streptomyces alkaliterrae TaxID=2213162 RepID=A0A7W3WL43_9ACTN|nr:methyltransferase domain-containing protein [Streptomyces alkaliterrae]MBB1253875.1 methyltransferase domain-containing protein [Streptomyces alkaliterrae]
MDAGGTDGYWNHNAHYHPLVLAAVPDGCRFALEVGCGDGLLARKLSRVSAAVTAVDRSAEMVRQARRAAAPAGAAVDFRELDVLDPSAGPELPSGSYDFVCSVAVLHHLGTAAGLRRMAELLRPGGILVVVGLARTVTPPDWLVSAAGVPAHRVLDRRHGGPVEPAGMPVAEPAESWGEVRRTSARILPGRRWRRRLLWRYSIHWRKP